MRRTPQMENKKPRWLPPPKPQELRDVHVVDLNEERTNGVDYFILINERKRELEKRTQEYSARIESESQSDTIQRTSANPSHSIVSHSHHVNAPASSNIGKTPVGKASAILPQPHVVHKMHPPQTTEKPFTEIFYSKILIFKPKIKELFISNKKTIALAASLAFVFTGTFVVVHYIAKPKRELASPQNNLSRLHHVNTPEQETEATETAIKNPVLPKPIKNFSTPTEDLLGTGKNKNTTKTFGAGSVTHQNPLSRPHHINTPSPSTSSTTIQAAPANPPLVAPQTQPDAPREPPQFYSSSEESPEKIAQSSEVSQPNTPQPADPNAGTVTPPTVETNYDSDQAPTY